MSGANVIIKYVEIIRTNINFIYIVFESLNLSNSLVFLTLTLTAGGMASKEFRAITYQVTQKVGAGNNPSRITETLIAYTACYAVVLC
jgi:hypothetical protein